MERDENRWQKKIGDGLNYGKEHGWIGVKLIKTG